MQPGITIQHLTKIYNQVIKEDSCTLQNIIYIPMYVVHHFYEHTFVNLLQIERQIRRHLERIGQTTQESMHLTYKDYVFSRTYKDYVFSRNIQLRT